jgi:hypothetical protein
VQRIELAPAVAEGAATLGGAVALACNWPYAHGLAWSIETIERIELAAAVLRHAAIVVGFATGAEGGPPGLDALLLRAVGLRLAAVRGDVRPLVAASLADALCMLVGPVVPLVDDLERGPADASTLAAVLRVTLDAYQATAAAGLALVARRGLSWSRPKASQTWPLVALAGVPKMGRTIQARVPTADGRDQQAWTALHWERSSSQ